MYAEKRVGFHFEEPFHVKVVFYFKCDVYKKEALTTFLILSFVSESL